MTFPPSTLWSCFGFLNILGYEKMKLPTSLTRNGAVKKFAGPEPAFGVSTQNIRNIIRWIHIQQMAMWWVLLPPRDRLQN
jgi:hypothetical protein